MRASEIGRAARRDLQLRIPRRPVVRRGVRVRPEEGAWVVEGARRTQVLRGQFARDHMGALLEACDGTRDLAQVGEAVGVGAQAVFEAVSLLWTGGIVEEGDTEPLVGLPVEPELACLLSRLGDSTGANDSWQDAARRLAAARVTVLGDPGLSQELVRALSPTLPARTGEQPRAGDTLVVLVEAAGATRTVGARPPADPAPTSAAVAARCWEAGVALLRVRAEHDAVTVGPYVDRSFSPCLECGTAGEPALAPPPGPGRQDLVTGLAARAVAAVVSRATTTHLPGDVRRTDLATFTFSDRPATTRPGCPVCSVTGLGQAPVAASAPVGARYEQSVAIPPAAFADPKGHQQHYQPANLRLQRELRDWPSCPRTPLPEADLGLLEQPWPPQPVVPRSRAPHTAPAEPGTTATSPAPALLATILALAVGVREPRPRGASGSAPAGSRVRRWTAAGGNIGSVTAYVLVPGTSAGDGGGPGVTLAPGTYVYVEHEHALAVVGPAVPLPHDVGVRLVLTGNVDKVARKYLAFALRIAVQDCGCSFEVVRLLARCLGLPLRARARWDEREVAAALGTDPEREPVCAVIDLGGAHAQ